MPSHLNPLYNARSRREFQDASEQYGTSRFSPEMAELYELQRQMIAARYAPQGGATSQPVESRDDIIRRKMLAYNPPPDPNQAPPESIDQWTRIRNYLGEQLTTGQDSPYPIEDARPATPADYAAQGPAYQQQFRDALASEDAPAPPPPAPFSMGAIPELTAQGAQDWENRRAAIERAGQPIDTSPEAQASRRRNRALLEIGAQSPEKAAEVAALLENTRPATIANTIPQSDLPSGAYMIALQGLTPIVDAATFLPRIAMKALPGDEPQFSKDYLNMADMRAFTEQVPSRSSVEGAGRLAAGLGGEVGAFFVPGAMPVQKGVASLTSRMAARALPTSSKVLAGARNLGAGVVGFELPHYAETVLGGESHGEEAMNPLGAPFRLVRDVLGDVSGSLEHPGVINVIRNAGYYADMTPESLDLLRRNLAPATILALPMALHKMGDAGKAKSAETKDAMKSGDPARVQKAISGMDAPMRDQVATTADDLIMLQRTITPPPMPLAPGTQMPQGGRVVRLGEVVGDREAGQMERAGFIAPSDAAQNVPSAEVPPASLTDALNRARQYGPPRPPKPPSEGATDEASARTSQPEGAQGGEATPRLEGAGPPQAARPQQGSRLEALAAGTPVSTVNGMTLAARFNEWLESSGRPIVRSQSEFLEWLERPRSDNRGTPEDPNAPSMTEQFLAWAQKNPSTIQPPAPTQSPTAPAPTLTDRMAAMRMNPIPEKPGGFSLTAALRSRMMGPEVTPMTTTESQSALPPEVREAIAPATKEAPAAEPPAKEAASKQPREMTGTELKQLADRLTQEKAAGAQVAQPFQPYQVTKQAYVDYAKLEGRNPADFAKRHKELVDKALSTGADLVPPEVLADYPDLAAKYASQAAPASDTISALPPRTADTMSDAIAMSSPSGRMSKRAKDAARARLSTQLFGEGGLTREKMGMVPPTETPQATAARLRAMAKMAGKSQAKKLIAEAEKLESQPSTQEQSPARRPGEATVETTPTAPTTPAPTSTEARVSPPTETPTRAKEPWAMTRDDAVDRVYKPNVPPAPDGATAMLNGQPAVKKNGFWSYESSAGVRLNLTDPVERARLDHQVVVEEALRAGKPVPPEVLADYPDLAAKYASQAAPASEQVPPFTPDTPRGSVYRIRVKDKGEMYAVRESDNPRGGGDPVFESLADARKHAEGLPERDRVAQEQRESREAAAREKAEQEAATKAKRENLSGFGDDLPPMKKALAVKVLDAQVRSDGKVYKLRDLIAEKVQEGFTVEENSSHDAAARKKLEAEFDRLRKTAPIGNENHPETQRYLELKKNLADPSFPQKTTRVLSHPDGRFNDSFNKTALDYAEHLIKARNESPARRPGEATVETTPVTTPEKSSEAVKADERQASSQAEGPKEGLLTPTPSAQGDTNRPPAQVESSTTPDGLDPVVWERLGFEASQKGRPYEPPEGPQTSIRGTTSDAMLAAREAYAKGWQAGKENKSSGTPLPAQVESTGESKRFGRFSDDVDAIHEAMASGEKFQLTTHLRSTLLTKPEHIRASAGGVQVLEGKDWVTLTDRQVANLKAQVEGAFLRKPLKGLTGNEAKEGVVINRLDAETGRPVTETFRLLQYSDMDAALKAQAEKFVSSSAHANMRSGGISLFVVETPGKEPRIIRAVSKNNDPAGQFRDEMVSRLTGSATLNDAKPGNKNAEKLLQQKAEYDARKEARSKQVREEMALEQAEMDAAVKAVAEASHHVKFKKQPITVKLGTGKPSTFDATVSGDLAYHRPLGADGKPERGGGYVVTHIPTGRVISRDIGTVGTAKEVITSLQRFLPVGVSDATKLTDAIRESLGRAEVPLSDFTQAAGRGDAAKLWVIGDRIAESLAGAKEPQRSTGTPSVAPSNTPPPGKGLITDAGDVARVEAAKEVIKKAVKDSQSRLGTLGGTLEPYFNKEFARAVGDLASIYTKAVMRQGYAQLLEYTDAAFGRFKEFLATHLPEHADVLGQVQGGKFLRRVWARAVASQRDLKNLGVAEKKAQWRAREAFVTGEQVERGRVSLRKAMSEARKDAKKPMISLELTHGLTPQMVNRIKGEDRADALRAMNEVANPLGEIGGVSEAIAALEKAGGKVRNLTPQQIDTLASVAEAFSKVSENARALHKDGKILDVNEFAVEGAGDVMKDKPFDLDRRPLTSRIMQKLRLKKKDSGDPFQTDAGLRENAMGILRYIHDGASEPYQMIENFFGRDSKVYDYFFNSKEGVRAGDTLSKEAEMRARDPVEKVLVDLGMNRETEEAKFRTEKRKFKAGSQELTLTGSEALDLYNHLRASGGNGKRIEENGFKLFTERNRKGKIELTGQDAQAFVDNVPENIRRLSDAMMESGRTLHGYWARMYERIFGVRAGDRGPNYWSIMTDTSMRRSLETTLDKYLPTGDLVDSPFTKARAEMTGEPMLITDGLAKWRSMVTQQSRYAGLAEPLLKMRAIINHPDVRDALVRKYGQKVLDKFNTMLEIQSGFRERMGGPEVAGVNKWIKDKTTAVTAPLLAGSLRAQVMSNVTGALQYMKEVDARDFNTAAYGLAKDIAAGRYGALREALKENGYLHNRLDTPTRRLLTPTEWRGLDPTEHKMIEVLNRMSEWVGKNFAGRGDDLNTVLAYKIAEAKAAREGKNPSRAELLTEAEKLVRLTQNPSSLLDMSVSAVDARKTWWGSMYFFIQNGALKARSSLERSIHKGGTEAVKGIALAGLETLGGRIAQTAQWAATALPFMADNDKRKDPGRVAESNLAQAVAEVVDLIVPGAGIAVRQAHAASRYNKAPNFSPLADVQQAMVQVGGTAWGGVAEAMGLRKESKTPTSRKLYKATLGLLRAMAPFYKIPPQFMTPLREAMREKPRKKPIR